MTGETETDSPRPSSRKPSERPSAAPLPLPFSLFLSFSQAPELLTCSCSNFKRQLYFSRRGTPLSPRRTLNLSRTRPGSSPQLVELAFVKSHARDFLERSTWQYAIPSSAPPPLSLSLHTRSVFCILHSASLPGRPFKCPDVYRMSTGTSRSGKTSARERSASVRFRRLAFAAR